LKKCELNSKPCRRQTEVAFTNFVIQNRDGQKTNEKTSNSCPRRRAKFDPHQTWQVIEEIHSILAPPKRIRIGRFVLPLGGTENLG